MTHNERVLHTVLSMSLKDIPEAQGDKLGVMKAKIVYMENLLEEIANVVSDQVQENALKAMSGNYEVG